MPVFTLIATAAVEYVIGAAVVAGTAAAFAVSVIAVGLAAATARLFIGAGSTGGGGTQNQGVRVQLPPNTELKIPIIYGHAFQQGIITDARISNENKTMTYVLVLSEKTTSTRPGNWTLNNIFWNDQRIIFHDDGFTVASSIASDGTTNTNFDGLIKFWTYAGGADAQYQIQGPATQVNAYDIIPSTTNNYKLSDLVFGVVEITYDSAKNVTGLPAVTYELNNSLNYPGAVWLDYLTNNRYGCGFSIDDIDRASIDALDILSSEIPPNQYDIAGDFTGIINGTTLTVLSMYAGSLAVGDHLQAFNIIEGTSIVGLGSGTGDIGTYFISTDQSIPESRMQSLALSQQPRYQINGILNTGDTVKTNIDKINMATSSWTTYDHKIGQWRIVSNRAATQTELDSAQHFTDDNILSDITVISTNLEDLYNSVEVSFANRATKDQTDYYRSGLTGTQLNTLEPKNTMRIQTALANNGIHAGRIGNIELRQTRLDLIITFTADYSALKTEVGDIIKVTNRVYGFDNSLFRVTRVRETEGEDGTLAAEISGLQYDAAVYSDLSLSNFASKGISNIPLFGSSSNTLPPSVPIISNIINPDAIPRFDLTTVINPTSGAVSQIEWYASLGGHVGAVDPTADILLKTTTPIGGGVYSSGISVTDTITTLSTGTYHFMAQTIVGGVASGFSGYSMPLVWDPIVRNPTNFGTIVVP